MSPYSTPLEIYLSVVFAMAAIAMLLALWAIASIAVEVAHHRRDEHRARAGQPSEAPHRPRTTAAHAHGPILH
jgi:fatty-acid desaturase